MKIDWRSFEEFLKDEAKSGTTYTISIETALKYVEYIDTSFTDRYEKNEYHTYTFDNVSDRVVERMLMKDRVTWWNKLVDKFYSRKPVIKEYAEPTFEEWKTRPENKYPCDRVLRFMGIDYSSYFKKIVEKAVAFGAQSVTITDNLLEKLQDYKLIPK